MWEAIGKALANVAKYSAKGALWASNHPDVVATVATVAGHPEVAAVIAAASRATK